VGQPGDVPAQNVELLRHVPDVLAVVLVHLLQQVGRLHTNYTVRSPFHTGHTVHSRMYFSNSWAVYTLVIQYIHECTLPTAGQSTH
jgi:hypothetical protein